MGTMDESRRIQSLLSKELCDKLVQSSSLTIGCNVLITDERGYVISSDDQSREGNLHEASLEVIASGQKAYHDQAAAQRLAGTRPGMTIPLVLEGQVVGTIGITGSPEEVSKYALLIQQMAEIFLSFQSRQQTSAQRDSQKQTLLREIITFDRRIRQPDEVYSMAYEMGIDLRLPRAVVLLRKEGENEGLLRDRIRFRSKQARRVLRKYFGGPRSIIFPQSDMECVILAWVNAGGEGELRQLCQDMEAEAARLGWQSCIGIGRAADTLEGLRRSYEDACFAVRVLQTGVRRDNCLSIRDLVLERLAASLPEETCLEAERDCYAQLLQSAKFEETMQLIDHWCRLHFHFTRTAEAMHIHKSTLVYRFQRIQELYGLDLYDYDRVTALFLLNIRRRLK